MQPGGAVPTSWKKMPSRSVSSGPLLQPKTLRSTGSSHDSWVHFVITCSVPTPSWRTHRVFLNRLKSPFSRSSLPSLLHCWPSRAFCRSTTSRLLSHPMLSRSLCRVWTRCYSCVDRQGFFEPQLHPGAVCRDTFRQPITLHILFSIAFNPLRKCIEVLIIRVLVKRISGQTLPSILNFLTT